MKNWVCLLLLMFCFNGCRETVPHQYVDMLTTVRIDPDYRDIIISYDMSPLNFRILEEAESYLTCIKGKGGDKFVCRNRNVVIDDDFWKSLLEQSKGDEIKIEIYLKKQGIWYKYPIIKKRILDR